MRRATSAPYSLKGKFLGKIERQVEESNGKNWFYAVTPEGERISACNDRGTAQRILRERAGLK